MKTDLSVFMTGGAETEIFGFIAVSLETKCWQEKQFYPVGFCEERSSSFKSTFVLFSGN